MVINSLKTVRANIIHAMPVSTKLIAFFATVRYTHSTAAETAKF